MFEHEDDPLVRLMTPSEQAERLRMDADRHMAAAGMLELDARNCKDAARRERQAAAACLLHAQVIEEQLDDERP